MMGFFFVLFFLVFACVCAECGRCHASTTRRGQRCVGWLVRNKINMKHTFMLILLLLLNDNQSNEKTPNFGVDYVTCRALFGRTLFLISISLLLLSVFLSFLSFCFNSCW